MDDDSDGYVECVLDSGGWDTSPSKQGGDCLDTDATVSPGDAEICDGQDNDCSAGVPADETDNDSDGYVECTIHASGWDASPIKLGDDCDDTTAARDPGNTEICDASNVDEDCDNLADDLDPSATGQTTWYTDSDSDGFGTATPNQDKCDQPTGFVGNSTDCDDTDATVNPSASEICDGQDNDCNTAVPTNETDDDGDGYVECTEDVNGWDGTATLFEDCDDGDANINPGGSEICDASDADEDCDGLSDDDDSSATGQTAWYTDSDSDGYGDQSATATQACNQPTGQAATNNDCDDTDSSINPGATEICDASATDEDCNGVADDNDSGVTGTTDYYTDSDGDGEGDEDGTAQARCIQPSGTVADNSDCDDSEVLINTGGTEISNEEDDDCDDLVDEGFRSAGDMIITELEGDPAGFSSDQSQGQWIEVYNTSTTTDHHMGGYAVYTNCDGSGGGGSATARRFYIPVDGLTVGAGDYAVLCKSASAAGGNCDYVYGSNVNDSSSAGVTSHALFNIATGTCRVQLFMPYASQEVDKVAPRDGTSSWPTKVTGVAFCLDPNQLTDTANDDGSNWGYPATTEIYDAVNSNYGTPGTAASSCSTGTWSP